MEIARLWSRERMRKWIPLNKTPAMLTTRMGKDGSYVHC